MGDAKVHGGARRIDLQPGTFPATQDVSTKSLSHSGNTLQVHRRKANLPGLRENHGQPGSHQLVRWVSTENASVLIEPINSRMVNSEAPQKTGF
jgi:hypothetical protein